MNQPKPVEGIAKVKLVTAEKMGKNKTLSQSQLQVSNPTQPSVTGFFTKSSRSRSSSFPSLHVAMSDQITEDHEPDLEAPVLQEGIQWVEASELSAEYLKNMGNDGIGSAVNTAQSVQSTYPSQSSLTWAELNADKRKYAAANTDASMSGSNQVDQSDESAVNVDTFGITSLRHKAEVPLVFIAYK